MEIRPLPPEHLEEAALLAARAFADDPGFAFVTGRRPELLPQLFDAELRVDRASRARLVGAFDPTLRGVAVWYPPGGRTATLLAWLPQVPRAWRLLPGPALRGLRLQEAISRERSARPEASYLRLLAVEPGSQGRGLGAALIERVAAEAFGDVYLETAAEANIEYYRRRGFAELKRVDSPGLPPFWAMLRPKAC